jgi:two-component system, NarL family, sensor histidine kinase YdfH
MESTTSQKGQYIGLPFYIFISLLLGTLAVVGTLAVAKSNPVPVVVLYVALFLAHIGLYWLNLKQVEVGKWFIFYYIAQTLLIIALVNFSYGNTVNITILGSMVICIIGEVLGLWGNTRRSLFLGLFYLVLILALIFFLVEPGDLPPVISTLLINGGFIVLFMVVLNQQLAERQKAMELAESLESANAKLAASAAKIESLTLQNERQRMARELHDTLAQGVAGLVLQLEAVKAHLGADRTERAASIIEQALTRARTTLAESRAAIDDLRSAPANLSDAIREKVERFQQATGIPCELNLSSGNHQVSPDIANHALSVLSEALTNIARHAQASQVTVKFSVQSQQLELEVRDNGRGFAVNDETGTGHYGLLGMRERARLTGGTLQIESNAQSGTRIHFVIGRPQ